MRKIFLSLNLILGIFVFLLVVPKIKQVFASKPTPTLPPCPYDNCSPDLNCPEGYKKDSSYSCENGMFCCIWIDKSNDNCQVNEVCNCDNVCGCFEHYDSCPDCKPCNNNDACNLWEHCGCEDCRDNDLCIKVCGDGGGGGGDESGGNPRGWHDSADCTQNLGWACDGDNYNRSLTIKFYADGPVGTGTFLGSTVANLQRERRIKRECGGNRKHGFSFTTPESLMDGKTHSIYAYAINIGQGRNVLLNGSPKSIQCAPLPSVPPLTPISTLIPTNIPTSPFTPPSSCSKKSQGDANCDGQINNNDYQIWKDEFLGNIQTKESDFNSSNKINLVDFEIWRKTVFDGLNLISPVMPTSPFTPAPTPTNTPIPTPTLIISEKIACQNAGGVWKEFINSCADRCGAKENCLDVITESCECGDNKCWSYSQEGQNYVGECIPVAGSD